MDNSIRLSESDLRDMIHSSVCSLLREGFFDDVRGAMSGAYSGYKSSHSVGKYSKLNGDDVESGEREYRELRIAYLLKRLYDVVGWLCDEYDDRGLSTTDVFLPTHIEKIESLLGQIKKLSKVDDNLLYSTKDKLTH